MPLPSPPPVRAPTGRGWSPLALDEAGSWVSGSFCDLKIINETHAHNPSSQTSVPILKKLPSVLGNICRNVISHRTAASFFPFTRNRARGGFQHTGARRGKTGLYSPQGFYALRDVRSSRTERTADFRWVAPHLHLNFHF